MAGRLAFLAYWQWKDIGDAYGRDLYYSQALAWLGYVPLTWMDATHPPMYTLFLTAVLGICRTSNPMPVLLLQCVLSAATCVLIGRIAARLADERAAKVAAVWAAVDLPMIFFVPQLQTETFFLFVETVFFLWLLRELASDSTSRRHPLALGLFGGVAALTRSAFASYPAFFLLTLYKMGQLGRRRAFFVLFCVGWAAPILIWTARNWALYERVIPISAQMGWNLYEGFTLDRETVRRRPFEMTDEAKRLGITDPVDMSDHFKDKVLSYVRAHPFDSARIFIGKAFLYWRPWVYDPYTPAQRVFMSLYFSLLFAMALLGAWAHRAQWKAWWPAFGVIITFTVTHSIFATFARYRLPLEPLLLAMGGAGVVHAWDRRKERFQFNAGAALGLILLGAAILRLVGISWGLPAVWNADEPHLVNTAVSFGSGSLRPHEFKYPTLWMYTLFASYGGYFAVWSGLGLLQSVRQFGELYVWNPTGFYLIARFLAAAASVFAIERTYRAGKLLWGSGAGLWAAGLLAVSPVLVTAGHAAKPDCLMFLFAAWAWWLAARYWRHERTKDLARAGAAVGLAMSTQFTALPLAAMVPAAGWAKRGLREKGVWIAGALAVLCFFAGSPFLLIELKRFLRALEDQRALEMMGSAAGMWRRVTVNIFTFAGPSYAAAAAFALGALLLVARDRRLASFLLVPVAAAWLFLARSPEGSWQRYLFAVFPAVALTAGYGLSEMVRAFYKRVEARAALLATAVAVLAAMPGALQSLRFDRVLLLPDTRAKAADWIALNVPEGSKVLLDQEHASPRLAMAIAQARALAESLKKEGHPRARYYDLMVSGHRGGGWWIYRVRRDASDLHTNPAMAEQSAKGQPTLDVRAGLKPALAAGVRYVVLTSHGADRTHSPDLIQFLDETESKGKLLIRFAPEEGKLAGPDIRIYDLVPDIRK